MKKFFLFILIYALNIPYITYAQLNMGGNTSYGTIADELSINIVPQYPQPKDQVKVQLEMYTENLDASTIYWYLDNKLVAQGKGLRNYSFIAPAAGKSTTLKIKVVMPNNLQFEKETTIKPAGLTLIWEASSYTPPFYQGKALFPPQGEVKVAAYPELSNTISSVNTNSNLVYTWKVNDEVRQNISGYGKNKAIIAGPILGRGLDISVVATDPTTNITAQNSIYIPPVEPTILFYENSPLYGVIWEKAITKPIELKNEEVAVLAVPYNLNNKSINYLHYVWRINGIQAEDLNGRSVSFRKPEGKSGTSNISLEFENGARPLQSSKSAFSILFKE